MSKPHIYDLDYDVFSPMIGSLQGSQYTAEVWRYLYRLHVSDFHEMVLLPYELRSQLEDRFSLTQPVCENQVISDDGNTRKDLLIFNDGQYVDVVLLRNRDRFSDCVSTQEGSACDCAF